MLQTMEPFFIRSSWSLVTTFLFPRDRHEHSSSISTSGAEQRVVTGTDRYCRLCFIMTSTAFIQVTSARDDDINLANDLIQLDHPESIHAVYIQVREVQPQDSVKRVTNKKVSIFIVLQKSS